MISNSILKLEMISTSVYSLTLPTCTKSLSEDGVINNLLLEKDNKLLIKLLKLPLESVNIHLDLKHKVDVNSVCEKLNVKLQTELET
jgi:hypothetical protein